MEYKISRVVLPIFCCFLSYKVVRTYMYFFLFLTMWMLSTESLLSRAFPHLDVNVTERTIIHL